MMRLIAAIVSLLMTSCGAAERPHEMTIVKIEKQVRLPNGASGLANYARYYAQDGAAVVGVYTTYVDTRYRKYDLAKGRARWLDDLRDLPELPHAGCSTINVVYDTAVERITSVACEGFG